MAYRVLTYKGVSVVSFGHYIPLSSDKHDDVSKRVLAFKKGEQDAIEHFMQETRLLFMHHQIDKTTFSVATIPSSTVGKAHKGFSQFFRGLSSAFPIDNPTSNILYRTDSKQPAHLKGDRSTKANESTIAVHKKHGNIKGKNIILFDDILTSGNSMKAGIDVLKKKGANILFAIVMGRTV